MTTGCEEEISFVKQFHFKKLFNFKNPFADHSSSSKKSVNLIYVGLGFGLLYWIMESVRDVLTFDHDSIVERLFSPGFMTFWMRLLVVLIILLFSIYAQTVRRRIRSEDKGKTTVFGLFKISVLFGVLYWVIEAFRDTFVFNKGNFIERIFMPDPTGFWMRLLPLLILILFGIYSQVLIDEQKKVEKTLRHKKDELQKLVDERTCELLDSNFILQKEIEKKDIAQKELFRVNRVLRTLSACNRSLVNIPDEQKLIETVCKLLVQKGGYAFTWVAYFKNDEDAHIELKYKSGTDDNYLEAIQFESQVLSQNQNPIANLKATGQPVGIHYATIDSPENWITEAIYREFQSSLFLPLYVHEKLIGLLAIFSKTHRFIDDNENDLIIEMANDLAFGISTIRMRSSHHEVIETLKESERKYGTVIENLNVGIFRYNPEEDGKFIEVNPALLQILKFSEKETFLQTPFSQLFQFQTDVRNFNRKMTESGHVRDEEVLMRCQDGEPIWCSVNAKAIINEFGKIRYYDGVIENINNRKKLEREKKEMQLQLFQAQKMEEVGILAGGVAHDFNNILMAMLGISELGMGVLKEEDDLYKDMKEIHELAKRGAGITRQLLIFSRKQHVDFELVHFNKIIDGLKKMLNRLIGETILIETNLDNDLWPCFGDQGTIEQVIMNLVVNARDAMVKGGTITIDTRNTELNDVQAKRMQDGYAGSFIKLAIKDEGTGMEPSLIRRIFEPFFSTKGTGKGTGLGLSVVYGIIKQHKGWIHVESEMEKGTTFNIYIPANTETDLETIKQLEDKNSSRGNGERILVIEDDEKVLEFLSIGLKQKGYEVLTAKNGKSAMTTFFQENGRFQFAISDVVLPDENGLHLIEELLSYNPTIRVILSSGYTDKKSCRGLIEERGFHFLQKPFTIQQLTHALNDVA